MATVEVQDSPPESKRARLDDDADLLKNTLSENDVGILEYMYPKNAGFKGTLKGRQVAKCTHIIQIIGGRTFLFEKLTCLGTFADYHQLCRMNLLTALR